MLQPYTCRTGALGFILVLLLSSAALPAHGAVGQSVSPGFRQQVGGFITVNSTADTVAEDGRCTLREAIMAANEDRPVGGCEAGDGADTIGFDFLLPGITLAGEQLPNITEDLTIDGRGNRDVVIDGSNASRIFAIEDFIFGIENDARIVLTRLVITNGWVTGTEAGAAILNEGNLTINNVTFTGNEAAGVLSSGGAILNEGTLMIHNSLFTNNSATQSGGAITNLGDELVISRSIFDGNSSSNGGAIDNGFSRRVASISNSTFRNNSVAPLLGIDGGFGGAISNGSNIAITASTFHDNSAAGFVTRGGAIFNGGGEMTVANSTISHNQAANGGGIYNRHARIIVVHSTLNENSSVSFWNDDRGTATLNNSIIANSTGAVGTDCRHTGFILVINRTLVERQLSCSDAILGDPLLTPFTNNGGATLTHALRPGSPAIDAANRVICDAVPVGGLDQRGIRRPQGVGCDIGAFELEQEEPSGATFTVNQTTDVDDGVCSASHCTLREAINAANGTDGLNSILLEIPPALPIVLDTPLPAITDNLIIDTDNTNGITVNGNGRNRIFEVNQGADVTIMGLTMTASRGAILNDGTLVLDGSTFLDNTAPVAGAIVNSGDLTIRGGFFMGNTGTEGGAGAVHNMNRLTILDSAIQFNSSTGSGGGIHNLGTLTAPPRAAPPTLVAGGVPIPIARAGRSGAR